MKFEENSNLEFDERANLVYEEIKKEYPLIDENAIYKAAALSKAIDDKSTYDDKFDRYYCIMYIIGKEDAEFSHVYNDAYNLFSKNLLNEENTKIMNQITEYVSGYRDSFPEYNI